jgi:hypothetical protein
VVVLASIAAGLGGGLAGGALGMARETLGAVVGWVMWAGRHLRARRATDAGARHAHRYGRAAARDRLLLRAELLCALRRSALVGYGIRMAVDFWLLATTVLAVRQALDYKSTLRAFAVVLIGWLFFVTISWALRA